MTSSAMGQLETLFEPQPLPDFAQLLREIIAVLVEGIRKDVSREFKKQIRALFLQQASNRYLHLLLEVQGGIQL